VLVAHDAVKAYLIGPGVLLVVLIVQNVGLLGIKIVLGKRDAPTHTFPGRRR